MIHSEYDSFYTEPDTVEEMLCKVCGTKCEVERSETGPTGSVEASAGRGHWHDHFFCPNITKEWHKIALKLVHQIEETPSKRIAELMRMDLDDLLRENGCKPE